MTRDEIITAIREELHAAAPFVPGDASLGAHLKHDLDVDSLTTLEFVARLEYRFTLAMPDDDWERMSTMDGIADVLEALLVPS